MTSAKPIWHMPPDIAALNALHHNTIVERLGLIITEAGDDFLRGTLPVDSRTVQPFGLLHGGASVVLAETLGSAAANACVDTAQFYCVGTEINASHVRSARSGMVTGTARPLHLGKRMQTWDIRVEDEHGKLVCVVRLTTTVLPNQPAS